MTTVLQYLVIAAVIGLVLFGIALVLFGRGERLSALPARTSPARLPEQGIQGADVRRVRFALAVRGYRMSDVDWTLDRLADELDRTRQQLALVTGGDFASATGEPAESPAAPPAQATVSGIPPTGAALPVSGGAAHDQQPTDPGQRPGATLPSAAGLDVFTPGNSAHHDGADPTVGSPPPVTRPGSEA